MVVVADTTPLNYLVLIGQIDLLRILYSEVFIPPTVARELQNPGTPDSVRKWFAQHAPWLHVQAPSYIPSDFPHVLGPGEREAIALSQELAADVLLVDERDARLEAERRQLTVVGTLGLLGDAAERDLVDLGTAFAQLQATNFRASDFLYHQILVRYERRQRKSSTEMAE